MKAVSDLTHEAWLWRHLAKAAIWAVLTLLLAALLGVEVTWRLMVIVLFATFISAVLDKALPTE
jgi:hypothetical protein